MRNKNNPMPYDNLCKYLCEKYPDAFSSWIYGQRTRNVEVLKTELTIEPIRADSVTFLRTADRILHLEFQIQLPKRKPMPLRMLNYFVRLYWDYGLPITQVVIWLKPTTNPAVFENQFKLESTQHEYKVIRIWEESPELFLQEPALLPLATLATTENSSALLSQVAEQVSKIEEPAQRDEISACTQILAGLRFEKDVIRNFFREEIMQESVIYQDIFDTFNSTFHWGLNEAQFSRRTNGSWGFDGDLVFENGREGDRRYKGNYHNNSSESSPVANGG